MSNRITRGASSGGGSSGTQVYNEVVTFTGQSGTLSNTPTSGTLSLYGGGGLLQPNVDYIISGANITLTGTTNQGQVFLANYSH